jgi:hypothetical protein
MDRLLFWDDNRIAAQSANHFKEQLFSLALRSEETTKKITELTKTHGKKIKSNNTMVSCILPYYIHRQIYRCMNIYIQKYILTHYILFIHILIARTYTYIHTLRLSFSSIFDCVFVGSFFSQLLFYLLLFTFS